MNAITFLNAYKKTRDKIDFYQAQQGGDYSARMSKATRHAAKFEQALLLKITDDNAAMLELDRKQKQADAQAAEIARLRELLKTVREAIASLPIDALGTAHSVGCPPWPIRDELIHNITTALNGKKE